MMIKSSGGNLGLRECMDHTALAASWRSATGCKVSLSRIGAKDGIDGGGSWTSCTG